TSDAIKARHQYAEPEAIVDDVGSQHEAPDRRAQVNVAPGLAEFRLARLDGLRQPGVPQLGELRRQAAHGEITQRRNLAEPTRCLRRGRFDVFVHLPIPSVDTARSSAAPATLIQQPIAE